MNMTGPGSHKFQLVYLLGYGLGDCAIAVQFLAAPRNFSLLQAQPAICPEVNAGTLPRVKWM